MASSLKVYVNAQGNVGIGTLNPLHRLHVGQGNLNLSTQSSFRINNVPVLTETALGNSVISCQLQRVGNLTSLNVTGNLVMGGNSMVINTATNRVGLGTATPAYALDVVGNVRATTYLQNSNVVGTSSTSFTFDKFSGGNYFPQNTADTTSISGISGGYSSGVLAPNGKIYCFPHNATSVLIIDPVTDTTTTITGIPSGFYKWLTGVLAPNGKIYGIPYGATSVLIIDPVANTADITTITGVGNGGSSYVGGVLAPNGKIYGIPFEESSVLIIDPVANTANTTTITGLSGSARWWGGVLAPNGKIYCIPRSATSVLIIDPVSNTADTTTITGLNQIWLGGVLAPNGKIYGIPGIYTTSVLIIDPVTNTADTTTITGLSGAEGIYWIGGVLAPNGKIYGIPNTNTPVLIIDPATNTATTTTIPELPGPSGWFGGVLAPNGKIYGVPLSSNYVLILETGLPSVGKQDWMLRPYFNKF